MLTFLLGYLFIERGIYISLTKYTHTHTQVPYTFWIGNLYQIHVFKYFRSQVCLFILFMVPLDEHICFYEVPFISAFGGGDDGRLGLLCKAHKISPISIFANPQGPKDIMVSSWSFIVLVLEVGSLSPVDFCLWCEVGIKIYFPCGHSAALHIYWKDLSFSIWIAVGPLLKMSGHVFGSVSGLSSDPLGLFINSSIHPTLS